MKLWSVFLVFLSSDFPRVISGHSQFSCLFFLSYENMPGVLVSSSARFVDIALLARFSNILSSVKNIDMESLPQLL